MNPEGPNSVTKTHDLIEWFLPIISGFPRNQRYTLGEKLENNLFDILELLIQANYQKEKLDKLNNANMKLEIIRHLVRICHKLQFINLRRYEYVSNNIDEIGRLIGGWIRQQQSRHQQ
jgi:hypothetical protein